MTPSLYFSRSTVIFIYLLIQRNTCMFFSHVLFTSFDYKVAIMALPTLNHYECDIGKNCKKNINRLLNIKNQIALQWIPSHRGIYGNVPAAMLTKSWSQMKHTDHSLSMQHINHYISSSIKSNHFNWYREKASGKKWNSLLIKSRRNPSSLPGSSIIIACFRLALDMNT